MNIATIIVAAVVIAVVAIVVILMIKNRGKSGCGFGCEGCPQARSCHKPEKREGR